MKKLAKLLQKFGLSALVPKQRLQASQTDEERMYCGQPLPDGTSGRRSVIAYSGEDADRPQKKFEAPRLRHGGASGVEFCPTLHLSIDQGPVGLQAGLWMMVGKGLTFDVFHKLRSDSSSLGCVRFSRNP